jgi:hypothetical protein
MTYPLETQARAALRLTAAMLVRAQSGPSITDEPRRQSFLQVYPSVQAIADRAVYKVPDDGRDPRPGFIAALLRIAQIKPEAFARECGAVDAGERKVLGEAFDFMETLRGPAPRPVFRAVMVVDSFRHEMERGLRLASCSDRKQADECSLVDLCETEPERMTG